MDERKLPEYTQPNKDADVAGESPEARPEVTAETEQQAASTELDSVKDDLIGVDDDIAALPPDRQGPFGQEAAALHDVYDDLQADVSLAPDGMVGVQPERGTIQNIRAEEPPDQKSGELSIVFKPRETVPATLSDTRCKMLGVTLNAGESSLPNAEVASRLNINEAELLQKYNNMMETDFKADPWNARNIKPDDVMAWMDIDMNVAAIGSTDLQAQIARYADTGGNLSPKEVTRILGNQRHYEEDKDPTNLYADIERAKATRERNKKKWTSNFQTVC